MPLAVIDCMEAPVELPISQLRTGMSPRLRTEDVEHARALAEVYEQLPPILVHAETSTVVDGAHRLLAARLLRRDRVRAVFFHGTAADAVVEAVRHNVTHGKPLSLHEREAAAAQIVRDHPDWSDRRIATCCGLSPTTVGKLRARVGAAADERVGADGRRRRTGRGATGHTTRADPPKPPAVAQQRVEVNDAVCTFLLSAARGTPPEEVVAVIPLGYVYEAAGEARRLAAVFHGMAGLLEQRAQGGGRC